MLKAVIMMKAVVMLTFLWCFSVTSSSGENDIMNHVDIDHIITEVGRCTEPISNLKELAGNWRLYKMGKKAPPGSDTNVRLRLESDSTHQDRLIGTARFSTGYLELVNLTQIEKTNVFVYSYFSGNPDLPKILPVILIGYDPVRYMNLWQAGNGKNTADWALYVRRWVKKLDERELTRATEGLHCLNLVKPEV